MWGDPVMALVAEQASDGWLGLPEYPISINNFYLGRLVPATPVLGTMSMGRKQLQVLVAGDTSWFPWHCCVPQFSQPQLNAFPEHWLILHMLKRVSRRKEGGEQGLLSILCDLLHARLSLSHPERGCTALQLYSSTSYKKNFETRYSYWAAFPFFSFPLLVFLDAAPCPSFPYFWGSVK